MEHNPKCTRERTSCRGRVKDVLSLTNVDHYASASKIDTYVAERDVILTYVLKILDDVGLLKRLAFKGGTCLKKVYYGKTTRFSEDLDFTLLGSSDVKQLKQSLKQMLDNKEYHGIRFEFKDEHTNEQGYGVEIEYVHEWHSDAFDLEISYRENPALPVEPQLLENELYFQYLDFERFKVPSMHREELMAEKIRAAFQRRRARDIYDLYRYSQSSYNKGLVKTLAVIKCWNVRDPFNPNLLLNKIENERYKWDDLERLVRPNQMINKKKLVSETVKNYSYLTDMSDELKQIISDSKKHAQSARVEKILSSLTAKAA
jgi:predicted nucleotidyltransferase component of viral defense system